MYDFSARKLYRKFRIIQCFLICSSLPKVETRVGQHLSNEKFNKHIIQHLANEAKGTIVAFLHDKVSSVAMFETDRFYCTYYHVA